MSSQNADERLLFVKSTTESHLRPTRYLETAQKMDGCIMCENTLTSAASQKMLRQLEEVFQVSIVANIHRALFVCSRCEVNVHFIEGAMKLKKEMEEHLMDALDVTQAESGLPRAKRIRHGTGDGLDSHGRMLNDHYNDENREFGDVPVPPAHRRPTAATADESLYQNQSASSYDPLRPISYSLKRPRTGQDMPSRAPVPLALTRSGGVGATEAAADALGRPMGNGRLLQQELAGVGAVGVDRISDTTQGSRLYDVDRGASGALLHSAEQQSDSISQAALHGSRRRRGYPCNQCGKVLRTRAWLTRHLQSCGSDSPFHDDMEGMLSDQDSYSEDDTDADKEASLMGDTSAASAAMSTPASNVCACKDCGKTFKRKTWLLKHALQCVASRVTPSTTPAAANLGASMAPSQVGSALTCGHCGKRYLGRYDKYREHVKQCGLRANGGGVTAGNESMCTKCGDAVPGTSEDYEKHVSGCTGQAAPENTVHTCPTCGRCYAKRYDYFLRHVRSCHRDEGNRAEVQQLNDGEPCVCPRCSKMYRRADHLWQHMEMCRGIPGRNVGPHVCDKCGKTYGTRYDVLQRHVLTCKGVQPDADAQAVQRSMLSSKEGVDSSLVNRSEGEAAGSHMTALEDDVHHLDTGFDSSNGRSRISGTGPNECMKCGKVYTLRYDHFIRHVRKCRGLQTGASEADSYMCQKCNKDFGREYELYLRHLESCGGDESVNAEDGQHVCPKCGKICEKYDDLWAHVQECHSRSLLDGDASQDGDDSMGQAGGDLSGMRGNGKPRNVCAKCGKGYVLLTCYRKHVAKCIGGSAGSDVSANGAVFNGVRRNDMFASSGSQSPSNASNAADDNENPDDDPEAMSPYECDNCGASFGPRRASFLKHIALCTGTSAGYSGVSNLHVCEYCGKHFVRLGNYTRHVQVCQYATAAGGIDSLRQLHQRQCEKCLESVPADQYVSHIERCFGNGRTATMMLSEGVQASAAHGGDRNLGEGLSASPLLGASAAQQQMLPTTWTCPRCKKEFQQSGQYIRHISTCSMEFLKCSKCDFGRYYSDSKDFDNHVAACRGKVGTASGLLNAGVPAASSPLQLPLSDKMGSGSNAGDASAEDMSDQHASAYSQPSALSVRQFASSPPSSDATGEESESAVAEGLHDLGDASEFALQEEVVAANDGDNDIAPAAVSSEGPTYFDENAMLL